MLERIVKLLFVALLSCSLLEGCSSMSSSSRNRSAYARYVKKYSHNRVKQQTKFKRLKLPATTPSDSMVHTSTQDSPQSMTTGGESQSQSSEQ